MSERETFYIPTMYLRNRHPIKVVTFLKLLRSHPQASPEA